MSDISRRELVAWLATLPLAQAARAAERALGAAAPFVPAFFTAHEWRTVRVLVDYIIPRDERSGSATDAGVPEFMDFIMTDRPAERLAMRGGLQWLDNRCRDQFSVAFADGTAAQQTTVLDAITGEHFFIRFRDLTATGFWTSKMGIADLRYVGNTVVHQWNGCPEPALTKLGVSY
ncbi:MAG TPA: gluconate 2-dehydrogenase subunit 3 family protein [Gemmatimonadaceae bacterium]|nr:gluconate 2-dehydrogenase subunit 3 family protein [Gemmatimonadaceae bacterium]